MGRARSDRRDVELDARLDNWGRWSRWQRPGRAPTDSSWPRPAAGASEPEPYEADAQLVETAMLACKRMRPRLYRAGELRYVIRIDDVQAAMRLRCSTTTYRELLARLIVFVDVKLSDDSTA